MYACSRAHTLRPVVCLFVLAALPGGSLAGQHTAPPPAGVDELSGWLRRLAAENREACRLVELGCSPGGRAVLGIEVRPQHVVAGDMQRCAIICRQHGDEPDASAAGAALVQRLVTAPTLRTWEVTGCVAALVIPCANPDGAAVGTRSNSSGQDLNRDWGVGATPEVSAIGAELARWNPHLVIDVHQWVPGDECQEPMAVATGGGLATAAAAAAGNACRTHGYPLAARGMRLGSTLCTAYYGARCGIPALLLETRHVPSSVRSRATAVRTTVVGLLRVLDLVSERGRWADPSVVPFCGVEGQWRSPGWFRSFASRIRSLDRHSAAVLGAGAAPRAEGAADQLARGRVELELLNYDAALTAFTAAYNDDRMEPDAAFMLGAATFLGRSATRAVPFLEWALRLRPEHQGARLYLARCRELEGRSGEALKLYDELARDGRALRPYRRYARARAEALGETS